MKKAYPEARGYAFFIGAPMLFRFVGYAFFSFEGGGPRSRILYLGISKARVLKDGNVFEKATNLPWLGNAFSSNPPLSATLEVPNVALTRPGKQVLHPIFLLRLSLLTLLDSNFPANPLWAWQFHPLNLRLCLSRTP